MFVALGKEFDMLTLIKLSRFSVSPGHQKTLCKEVNTLFSYKRLEIHLLKEGKLGGLECVVLCVTQGRKHLTITTWLIVTHFVCSL